MTTPASTPTVPAAASPAPAATTPTPVVPTTPAPTAAVPATTVPAAPKAAPHSFVTRQDQTPKQGVISKLTITAENAPAFLASIDPDAPSGKLAKIISVHVGPKGEIAIRIEYQP